MEKRTKWWQWLLVVLTICLTINSHFRAVIKNPNTTLFATGGDGLKNYLTPMLHVKNSQSYHHFDAMNYPYGEHVLFTDNQPLLSNLLKFWERNFGEVAYYTIGVLNYALLLSMLGAGLLLYGIFRRLELPHWYSLIVSTILIWLSPQLERFGGHYALGYMFILVLLLYFLLRFEDKSWRWSLGIISLVLLAPMLHFYYFGISALFLSFYYAHKVWYVPSTWKFYAKHWALQIIVPFIFLNFIWLKIDNPITDRPASPNGFLHYVTIWEGTFFNPGNILYDLIGHYMVKIRSINEFESINYIGFLAALFFFSRFFAWIFERKFKLFQTRMPLNETNFNFLKTAFWASFSLYLFSMGLPFIIPGCEKLLALIGPLKQFRGLGRFSWIFYFVINIVAFFALYQWSEKIKNIELRRLFYVILIIIGISEARTHSQKVKGHSDIYEQLKPTGELVQDWMSKIEKDKYQAIIPIPYYHLGAEYLGAEARGAALAYTLLPSYYTGLPTMGVMMSRTSWQQTLNSMPLGLDLYREPAVLRELPNQKPLLAIEYKQWHKERNNDYQRILEKGKKIHENAAFTLYELPIDAYRKVIEDISNEKRTTFANSKWITQRNGLMTKDSVENFVYQHFDESQQAKNYRGGGSFSFEIGENKVIFNDKIPNIRKGSNYYLQFWLNVEQGYNTRTLFDIRELAPNGEQKYIWQHGAMHNIVTLDDKWALVQIKFIPQHEDTHFEISLKNKEPQSGKIHIDEMLIYPEGAQIYKPSTSELMHNGKWW